jgi:hypothetical protein
VLVPVTSVGVLVDAAAGGAAAAASAGTSTRAARTITLNDSGHLRLSSHDNFTLNEQGAASGTIYIHLDVVSTNRVTAEVNIYPRAAPSRATQAPATTRQAPSRASPAR